MLASLSSMPAGFHSYVYLLVCVEKGNFLIKVGVSDSPFGRLDALRGQCPYKPKTFAIMKAQNRKTAFRIETALIKLCQRWRTRGEWMEFSPKDKSVFNEMLRLAFDAHCTSSCPYEWQQFDVRAIDRAKKATKQNFNRRYATDKSFRDFCRDR